MTVSCGIIALWISSLLLVALAGILIGAAALDRVAEQKQEDEDAEE